MDQELRDERNRRWDEPFGKEPLDPDTVAAILALPAFADVKSEDFPDWLPLERVIANDGRIRTFQKGETILRKGDYGSSLFIILSGSVFGLTAPAPVHAGGRRRRKSWSRSLAQLFARKRPPEYRPARNRTRGAAPTMPATDAERAVAVDKAMRVDADDLMARCETFQLEAPQMFGELAALTRSPRRATIYALENETVLFELRWQGLREIRDWSDSFRSQIDQLYHERGLLTRLQECPVFAHVDSAALAEIAEEALFETYGNFNWTHRFKREISKEDGPQHIIQQEPVICEQGSHVDGLLLINSGFARISERVDHGDRTIGHLSRNDVFGLQAIAAYASSNVSQVLDTSLRAIGYVDVIRIPTHLVRKHVLPGLDRAFLEQGHTAGKDGPQGELRQGMMDFLVDHRYINGEQAMLINLDRCVGCDDCVRACATAHGNNPRFVRQGSRFENAMIASACMHCTDPVCLIGCPTGAIHRAEDSGTVVIDDNTCIGCATCANSCPYNNIRMVEIRDQHGFFVKDKDGQPISRATKCDLCADQLTGPACVQACPHDALERVNMRDTETLLEWLK
ncbi:cyclic nucleotide-binding domain-containing protein [Roseibium sp. Sym1]|uniref:cyclic nucleotide-binding domain-containing protein n=1 Tax=Roseibium sp. Sym1 TaxID=3016006 RepID=UPI0022B2B8A5|nr:cyclic nucleotide-binding domain-containing protein [Roseibium sp. Sym1]